MYNKIKEYLDCLDGEKLIRLHNEYCEKNKMYNDEIYEMTFFDEEFEGYSPLDVLKNCFYSKHLDPHDSYYYIDGYGHPVSFQYADDEYSPIFTCDIARYIVDSGDNLQNVEIENLLERGEE